MSEQDDLRKFAISLADMARDLLAQDSVQATLDRICEHAVELVSGCEHAGILQMQGGQVETAAATSRLVRDSDRAQGELGEGPCHDAIVERQPVFRITDMEQEARHWPRYAPRARELGIGSGIGFLLYTEERELGALNLYSSQPQAFTEHSELVGWLLASHAAVIYSAARTHAQLESAIATRQEIGAALGIAMERYKITEDQAFDMLRKVSQDRNIKLRHLAQMITDTGELPPSQ